MADIKGFNRFTVIITFTGLLLALFGWAFASPVGASPDEDFHMVSSWCVGSGKPGVCEATNTPGERMVSTALILSACFAGNPDIGADCQTEQQLLEQPTLTPSSRGNFQSTYPALFYATMHQFASQNIQSSVIAMRMFNAALFWAVFVTLWFLLPKFWRKSLYFTVALTVVPLGLFLIPSLNPSSWVITGVFAAFFGIAGALQPGPPKYVIPLVVVSGLGVLVAGGARWDGLVYALIAVSASFLVSKQFRIPKRILWVSVISGLTLIGAFLIFGGMDFVFRLVGFAGNAEGAPGRSALGVLGYNIASITELWAGFSGGNGLGWLDTPVPKTAWMTAATLVWGALFLRLAFVKRIQVWVAGSLTILLIAVPLVTLQIGNSIVGENVQARYIFPLFLVLVATLLLTQRDERKLFSTAQLVVTIFGLFTSQALAVYANMTRYISGLGDGVTLNLDQAAETGWWWPSGPSPMFVLAMTVVGFGMFLFMAIGINPPSSSRSSKSEASAVKNLKLRSSSITQNASNSKRDIT